MLSTQNPLKHKEYDPLMSNEIQRLELPNRQRTRPRLSNVEDILSDAMIRLFANINSAIMVNMRSAQFGLHRPKRQVGEPSQTSWEVTQPFAECLRLALQKRWV